MKEEIKEILEDLKKEWEFFYISDNERKDLLNYITNLQEENERLKEIVENLTTMTASGDGKQIKNTAQFKLDMYKLRIDKAIEYIKENSYFKGNQVKTMIYQDYSKNILNILQGEDE